MATSLVAADSVLAIDVGAINARAMLYDVVDGHYRFLAMGIAPSTASVPYKDIGEGIHLALEHLQTVTGRLLLGADGRLMMPSLSDGAGVDKCVATMSAGPPLKTVAVGLLEDVSTESALHLASTTYAQIADTLSLNDRRKGAARIDAILRLRPDLVIIAGGTEGGASQSVMGVLESIGLACQLLPENQRPELLFVGNQALAEQVKAALHSPTLHIAPNIRPTLDLEQLEPAHAELAQIYRLVRTKKIRGVQELDLWTGGHLMPTATAFGRLIRFISRMYPAKGILGVDVGVSATTIAAAFSDDLTLGVYPQLGLGESLAGLLNYTSLEEIMRWLPVQATNDYIQDYLYNKAVHPQSLPVTVEDLAVEQALARQVLQTAVRKAGSGFPEKAKRPAPGLLPWFEFIIATGSVLANAPSRAHSLLMLLDALQPTGVTTVMLDQNNASSALGAAASINPVLTAQAIDGSFLSLGTVISPVGSAGRGTPILRVRVTYEAGHAVDIEVKFGALEIIPLPMGQPASLHLQPLHRFDIGMGGPGHGGKVNVVGGACGVVIDARGRPLHLLAEPTRRRELHKKWLSVLER